MNILGMYGGVHLGQHDPAAALICDGKLVAVCEEERFVRIKSPRGYLPINSIQACLREGGLQMTEIDLIAHPGDTYQDMPERIKLYLKHYFGHAPPIRMVNHQVAHMASAFYCSGFEQAMCLSYDAYGDRVSAALARGGLSSGIEVLETRERHNSLGVFYAAMTSFLGFQVSEDEYKVMGLAAFGREGVDLSPFIRPADDGYWIDSSYLRPDFLDCTMFEPLYSEPLIDLLGPPRRSEEPITQRHKDIAFAAQRSLEQSATALIEYLYTRTGLDCLCVAGGVGLNCSANLVIRRLPFVRQLFVQPAASDRGLALGCALQEAHERGALSGNSLDNVFKGPTYKADRIRDCLDLTGLNYVEVHDPELKAAQMLAEGKIIGWYRGRSEFGPRALGNRSILADPRNARMKDEINTRVKFREEFRPFAPSVLEERASELFDMNEPSPYMTVAYPVGVSWRSRLQAVVHVNHTARVQTVSASVSPGYHKLILEFCRLTGVPAVLNTSFNVRGQPIVETPLDAISTFAATGLDILFMENFMLTKGRAPKRQFLDEEA